MKILEQKTLFTRETREIKIKISNKKELTILWWQNSEEENDWEPRELKDREVYNSLTDSESDNLFELLNYL